MNMLRKRDMRAPRLEFASAEDKSIRIEKVPKSFLQSLNI
jgi:hypothetical protein